MTRNVGGGIYVHSLSFVPSGSTVTMAFHANAANVRGRTIRCPHRRGRPEAPVRHRLCWINRLPLPPWEIQWMLTICLNCLVKRGSPPHSLDNTLITVREWVQAGSAPTWSDCAGLSPELRSWQLQFGNLSVDSDDRLCHRRVRSA